MNHSKPIDTTLSEHAEQVLLFRWARQMSIKYPCLNYMYAIPNAGKRSPIQGKRMKDEGLTAGVPDICLPFPYEASYSPEFHGLYIEMKRKGKKPRHNQIKFMEYLQLARYQTAVCYTADEAIKVIEDYLEIKYTS